MPSRMFFVGKVFLQIVGIPMGTNCVFLLADIFLYSYETEFLSLCSRQEGNGIYFNASYRYINGVLCMNNPNLDYYLCLVYLIGPEGE